MHEAVRTLLAGEPVGAAAWRGFFDALEAEPRPAAHRSAVALLEALVSRPPGPRSAGALVDALDARRTHPPAQDAVNIVGSGGGPSTVNVSTAAALVAAALGVRVVKSGSRGYTSRFGSVDVLTLLGVPLTGSDDQTAAMLDRCGIAFAGAYAYPRELALLARCAFPRDWRRLGAFVNRIGPFLAAVPARAQLTGVSDPGLLPLYAHLGEHHLARRLWLCWNAASVDELVSVEANHVLRDDGTRLQVEPRALGAAPGTVADLRPAADGPGVVAQLTGLLAGDAPAPAVDSVCLNAAALALLAGAAADWPDAFAAAREAVLGGAALAVLDRLRAAGGASVTPVGAGSPRG